MLALGERNEMSCRTFRLSKLKKQRNINILFKFCTYESTLIRTASVKYLFSRSSDIQYKANEKNPVDFQTQNQVQ